MTTVHPVIVLTAKGAVVSAGGLVAYRQRRGMVEFCHAHVDPDDAARRRYTHWYRFFEGAWFEISWAWAEPFDSPVKQRISASCAEGGRTLRPSHLDPGLRHEADGGAAHTPWPKA